MSTLVFWFASEAAGALAGFFSALSLALYPRLFILIQSNIKDVPMLSWYILTVWTGWRAVELDDWRWLLVSAGALGVGMGSKSTAGFAFLILLVYLLVRQIRLKKLPSRSLLLAFLVAPFLSYLFIYMSNPIYWPKTGSRPQPVEASSISPKTGSVSERVELSLVQYLLGELKRAASPRSQHSRWGTASLPGWTSIRARFAFFATPMITNILAFIGILVCLQKFYHNEYGYYLMLVIWFFVPLLRTAAPHTIVYGGIRLYVDYVPALCLLAGLGALQVTVWLKTSCQPLSRFAPYLVLAAFLPVTYKLIRLHPYESIYFNSLMGGNEGAMESMYPSTGDVNCTTYPQAVAWFNRHAESGAGIVTVNTHLLNGFGLRSDLRAVFRPEEVAARDNVYYLMVPVSWNYEEEIPWKKENRILVKEIRPDDSPVLLIYKHRKRE
ncbi:MAG: ArnT family glycosyltransferase [bacterium]